MHGELNWSRGKALGGSRRLTARTDRALGWSALPHPFSVSRSRQCRWSDLTAPILWGVSGVIFDWDGVLLDSIGAALNVYNKIFERIGTRQMTLDEYLRIQSPNWYAFYREIGVPERLWGDIDREWVSLYQQERPNLCQDAKACLMLLRKTGFDLALVSNGSKLRIQEELARFRLEPFFRSTMFGARREELKPSPVMINRTLAALGLKAHQVVYVGDSPADIQAAKRAGVPSVAIARSSVEEERLGKEQPEFLFQGLVGLSDMLLRAPDHDAPHP